MPYETLEEVHRMLFHPDLGPLRLSSAQEYLERVGCCMYYDLAVQGFSAEEVEGVVNAQGSIVAARFPLEGPMTDVFWWKGLESRLAEIEGIALDLAREAKEYHPRAGIDAPTLFMMRDVEPNIGLATLLFARERGSLRETQGPGPFPIYVLPE
jgi:hypothetical protein